MIVTCPNCETKFEIPDDKYRPGRKARCSNCGFVFPLPEIDEPVAQPDAMPASGPSFKSDPAGGGDVPTAEDLASSLADDASGPDGEALPDDDFADAAETDMPPSPASMPSSPASVPPPPASVDDAVLPPQGDAPLPRRRSKKKLLVVLGIVLAVVLLGYGGIMVYSAFFAPPKSADPVRATNGDLVASLGGRNSDGGQEQEAARQAAVRRLALENVRQHTVTENEKTGPMVVIEGTVVNNFDTPKDLILLEVTLYDSKGNALVLREQYCGVTLSLLQLRTLPKAAIESALTSQVVILTNNSDIPPGGRVPFTTVFFDLPHSAYEFEVKIIDVQDPAPKK